MLRLMAAGLRCALLAACFAGPAVTLGATSRPIMVHYMPWFVGKPYSTSWGWHWTMNPPSTNYNPDLFGTNYNPNVFYTNGNRHIASHYYPLIGPYDSADPVVLEYHVLLMKLGGVDGVIVDWYGNLNCLDYAILNANTAKLFAYTRKAGLKFSICYEDQSITNMIRSGCITAANATSTAQSAMLYLQTNYFEDSSFLSLSNQPVLLNFGPQYFHTNSQWQTIFSVLLATNQPSFFTEDNRLAPVGLGAFPWPPMWMTGGGTNALTVAQLESYLTSFESKGAGWPAYVGGGWPRFNDIYSQAGVGASYGYLDDRSGGTLRETMGHAMTNRAAIVQIATWNDFGEGTIVEPTQQYGFRDLGIIQDFRRQYVQTNFPNTTNDVAMALRVYNLRRQYGNYPTLSAELDRIFTNICSGKLISANRQLSGMESGKAVLYDFWSRSNQFQFSIGGYVLGGAQVLNASDLSSATWQTARSYSPTTNLIVFTTNIVPQTARSFFKVQ
jgi:hypothetical protein